MGPKTTHGRKGLGDKKKRCNAQREKKHTQDICTFWSRVTDLDGVDPDPTFNKSRIRPSRKDQTRILPYGELSPLTIFLRYKSQYN